jgi:hypothetical protein
MLIGKLFEFFDLFETNGGKKEILYSATIILNYASHEITDRWIEIACMATAEREKCPV